MDIFIQYKKLRRRYGFQVTSAGQNGKARVLRESGVRLGQLAEEKLRAFGGIDAASMKTIDTKADARVGNRRRLVSHGKRADC
jgi:hypothetical protein